VAGRGTRPGPKKEKCVVSAHSWPVAGLKAWLESKVRGPNPLDGSVVDTWEEVYRAR